MCVYTDVINRIQEINDNVPRLFMAHVMTYFIKSLCHRPEDVKKSLLPIFQLFGIDQQSAVCGWPTFEDKNFNFEKIGKKDFFENELEPPRDYENIVKAKKAVPRKRPDRVHPYQSRKNNLVIIKHNERVTAQSHGLSDFVDALRNQIVDLEMEVEESRNFY